MGYINHTMKSVIIHYVNFDKRKYNFLEFPRYRVSRKKKKVFSSGNFKESRKYLWYFVKFHDCMLKDFLVLVATHKQWPFNLWYKSYRINVKLESGPKRYFVWPLKLFKHFLIFIFNAFWHIDKHLIAIILYQSLLTFMLLNWPI